MKRNCKKLPNYAKGTKKRTLYRDAYKNIMRFCADPEIADIYAQKYADRYDTSSAQLFIN